MVTLGQLQTFFVLFYLSQGSFETTFLPSQGRDRVCVLLTLPRSHLCDYVGYVVAIFLLSDLSDLESRVKFLLSAFTG